MRKDAGKDLKNILGWAFWKGIYGWGKEGLFGRAKLSCLCSICGLAWKLVGFSEEIKDLCSKEILRERYYYFDARQRIYRLAEVILNLKKLLGALGKSVQYKAGMHHRLPNNQVGAGFNLPHCIPILSCRPDWYSFTWLKYLWRLRRLHCFATLELPVK